MPAALHSAVDLMTVTGCKTARELRAWLRRNKIAFIDAPAGPIVVHEALMAASGLKQAQNDDPLGAEIFSRR